MPYLFALLLFLTPYTAHATQYSVNMEESSITFSGVHAGNEFSGSFNKWKTSITFNENDLENSKISVTFDMSQAKTDNMMYDGTLPTTDWFNVAKYPTATFKSTSITKINDRFNVTGDLAIKNITKPISFDFTLDNINQDTVMNASFTIDRFDYKIGVESDSDASWVDKDIAIEIKLLAKKLNNNSSTIN